MLVDDLGHSIKRNAHSEETEAEKHDQQNFSFGRNAGGQNDRHRKDDENDVNDGACSAHGKELSETLATLGPGVRDDLPVFGNRLTFGKIADDDSNEGCTQRISKEHGEA